MMREGEGRGRNRENGRGDFAGDIKGGKISLTQMKFVPCHPMHL